MYKKGVGRKWTRQFLENEASARAWRKFHRSRNDSSSGLGLRNYTYCYAILFSGFRVTFSFFFFSFFPFLFLFRVRVRADRSRRHLEALASKCRRSVCRRIRIGAIDLLRFLRSNFFEEKTLSRRERATSRFFSKSFSLLRRALFNVNVSTPRGVRYIYPRSIEIQLDLKISFDSKRSYKYTRNIVFFFFPLSEECDRVFDG